MYSTTGLDDSCDLMRSMTSITNLEVTLNPIARLLTPPARQRADLALLLLRHAGPLGDFVNGTAATHADIPCIEYTDLDTGRSDARWGWLKRHDRRGRQCGIMGTPPP